MPEPVFIDQTELGLSRMLSQWSDKKNITGLFKSYLENIQPLEEMWQQLLNERDIYSAIGAQLDVLGLIVGEPREGLDDDQYRIAILNRIAINSSDGTPPKVLEILRLLSNSQDVNLFEYFPASVYYYTAGFISQATPITMDNASAAGVSVRVMFDAGGDSFVGAGITQEENILGVNASDTLGVDVDGLPPDPPEDELGVFSIKDIPFGTRSYLPHAESGVTATVNPLCAVL